jgi:hypothetical protein
VALFFLLAAFCFWCFVMFLQVIERNWQFSIKNAEKG